LKVHVCDRCGRKVHGNAFHRHLKACSKKGTFITNETDNRRMF
jgi:ribosomal protein L37E